MNTIRKTLIAVLAAVALSFGTTAQARMTDRTEATIVGAAVGGVIGKVAGNNMESTLIGAAIGGTAGNLYAKRNQKKEAAEQARHHHASGKHCKKSCYCDHYRKGKKYRCKKYREDDDDDDDD
ncbi:MULTISPECIES: glycine zipper domain-containing protein [unclassified Neisseria]|nr:MULTISPECIES: glycine zipper domain-containing protein [unclassified Neisseria]MDO1510857.1 glycine zipper domain-containing protein [Neisseria sp. MVDL19-042950]MDO1517141.1 glycine zipper domain-containing protein [Neisseria sp. MVDL18-041461]MDO1564504.1 glycine zipper domain-containing protein [Neisseria sp. MVDL20-010259]